MERMPSPTPNSMERWINALWHAGNAGKCGLYGERVLHWPFSSNQEYLNGGGSRNEESCLIFLARHGYIELLKREAILLYCLFRALRLWTRNSNSLYSPQALVNASKVCSFRAVAEIKILMFDDSKRSFMMAIKGGMDLMS